MTAEESQLTVILNAGEQSKVQNSFKQLSSGHHAVDPPDSAPAGMRWSDVEIAVAYACDDVEMAVVSSTLNTSKTQHRFVLRTVEDWPGELIVDRADSAQVYSATATIGIYGDKSERAEKLLEAVQKHMKAFGRKRKIRTPDDQ